MNNMFLLGDSFQRAYRDFFTVIKNKHYKSTCKKRDLLWPCIVANELQLNFDVSKELSLMGSGNDHTAFVLQSLIMDQEEGYQKGDLVLIGVSELGRVWSVEINPGLSNLINMVQVKGEPFPLGFENTHIRHAPEVRAGREYQIYCHHEKVQLQKYKSWLNEIKYFRSMGHNIVLIPNFPIPDYEMNSFPTTGCLYHVDVNEFVGNDFINKSKNRHDVMANNHSISKHQDMRIGHLSPQNHALLAEKLLSSIQTNKPLDLTVGMKENFITKNNYEESETLTLEPVIS